MAVMCEDISRHILYVAAHHLWCWHFIGTRVIISLIEFGHRTRRSDSRQNVEMASTLKWIRLIKKETHDHNSKQSVKKVMKEI
jgi:hypothetical protein